MLLFMSGLRSRCQTPSESSRAFCDRFKSQYHVAACQKTLRRFKVLLRISGLRYITLPVRTGNLSIASPSHGPIRHRAVFCLESHSQVGQDG